MVVFDLDDTLYKEIDFLKSAYREIAEYVEHQYGLTGIYHRMYSYWCKGEDVFGRIISEFHLPMDKRVFFSIYRNHRPCICLDKKTRIILGKLKESCIIGIITDGRSKTQRNKIESLGLYEYVDDENILISEETGYQKPAPEPFLRLMNKYPGCEYVYIGDNTEKDFIAPNQQGWQTICIANDGRNIHQQDFTRDEEYLPKKIITDFCEIINGLLVVQS